VIMIEIHH